MKNNYKTQIAFLIANIIAVTYSQEIIHVDIEVDMFRPEFEVNCQNGYAEFIPEYYERSCEGGVNIPEDEISTQVGFWTACGSICDIKYTIQPDDTTFSLRVYQNNIPAEIVVDGASMFLNGNGWIDENGIDISGKNYISVRLSHLAEDYFAVMDRIAINDKLPPTNPDNPSTTSEPTETTPEELTTTTPEPPQTISQEPTTEGLPSTTTEEVPFETTTTDASTTHEPDATTTERPWNFCAIDDPMPLPPTCQLGPPYPDNCCPRIEDMPTYLPYPYDCKKFFECSNGLAICQRCANGTLWSQEEKVCVRDGTIPCNPPTTTTRRPFAANEYSIINFFKKLFF